MEREFYNLLKEDIKYVLEKHPNEGGLSPWDCFNIALAVFNELETCGEIRRTPKE